MYGLPMSEIKYQNELNMNDLYLGGHLRELRVGHLVLLYAIQKERDAAGVEELQMLLFDAREREHLHVFELGRERAFDHLRLRVLVVLVDTVLDVEAEGEARLEHLGRTDRNLKHDRCCTYRGKADLRHNTDRHFEMSPKTNRIKFLSLGLMCIYGN